MSNATPGLIVYALVPSFRNGGQDYAPAIVTRDVGEGLVDLTVFYAGGAIGEQRAVELLADRAAVDARAAQLVQFMPMVHKNEAGKPINPQSGEEWHPSDVSEWSKLAYWPARVDQAAAPEPAPAPAETKAELIARLTAELAQLQAE
jgi:hypothetical protein